MLCVQDEYRALCQLQLSGEKKQNLKSYNSLQRGSVYLLPGLSGPWACTPCVNQVELESTVL